MWGLTSGKELAYYRTELENRESELQSQSDAVARLERDNAQLRHDLENHRRLVSTYEGTFKSLNLFSDSIGQLQQSLAGMAGDLKSEKAKAVRGSEISTLARANAQSIMAGIAEVREASELSAQQVNSLNETARKIGDFVTIIRGISEQPKLLALNAAIEAARAGEMGRGFAVVADEVRHLASRSQEASSEISTLVASIGAQMESAVQTLESVTSRSQEFETVVADSMQHFQEQFNLSSDMERCISATALRSFVEIAKLDHLVFKFNIYKTFLGLSQQDPGQVPNHQHCRLGQWYFTGEGQACFSRLPGYKEMDAPHTKVHQHGREALEHLSGGRHDAGIAAIEAMELASLRVLQQLERLARSGEEHPEILCIGDH
jgi:myosin heavy subunit